MFGQFFCFVFLLKPNFVVVSAHKGHLSAHTNVLGHTRKQTWTTCFEPTLHQKNIRIARKTTFFVHKQKPKQQTQTNPQEQNKTKKQNKYNRDEKTNKQNKTKQRRSRDKWGGSTSPDLKASRTKKKNQQTKKASGQVRWPFGAHFTQNLPKHDQ